MDPPAAQPDGDWRLQVELREQLRFSSRTRHIGQIEHLVERERIGPEVALSYEGTTVFAYGSTAAGLAAADRAIRDALIADGRTAAIRAFRWDETEGSWCEVSPALALGYESATTAPEAPRLVVTRTASCSAGRPVATAYLKNLNEYAEMRGIDCAIVATPGMFRTRLEITITGTEDQVGQFLRYMRGLGKSKVDMGLIPYGL
jgi:hypothetical protein